VLRINNVILEKILAATPIGTREGLRWLKYRVMGRMSPAAYWNIAARISAKAAICTDCVDEQAFFESGRREANLLRKKGVLGPQVHAINIGCGIGRIENAICVEVASVTGVDISSRMVEMARQRVPALNVEFRTVDGRSLNGIESEHYDLCVSFIVLQHISRASTANYFLEVGRILKPDGHFLFQIPLRTSGRDAEPPANHPFGVRFYSREEVAELLQRGGLRLLEHFDVQGDVAPTETLDDPRYEFYLACRPK
jgi:SAM-dependent methyltransferase